MATVALGQESRHNLSGSPAQGLNRQQTSVLGLWSFLELVLLQANTVAARIQILVVEGWKPPFLVGSR